MDKKGVQASCGSLQADALRRACPPGVALHSPPIAGLEWLTPACPALPVLPHSRCTGYRPILDAFKAFAKVDAAAYTEEAIAASKAGAASQGAARNGHNGHACGNGACGACGGNGGACANGTAANGSSNGSNGSAKGGKGNGKVCPSTGRACDCGEVEAVSGTVTSSTQHKEAACGPVVHTRPAGACSWAGC